MLYLRLSSFFFGFCLLKNVLFVNFIPCRLCQVFQVVSCGSDNNVRMRETFSFLLHIFVWFYIECKLKVSLGSQNIYVGLWDIMTGSL